MIDSKMADEEFLDMAIKASQTMIAETDPFVRELQANNDQDWSDVRLAIHGAIATVLLQMPYNESLQNMLTCAFDGVYVKGLQAGRREREKAQTTIWTDPEMQARTKYFADAPLTDEQVVLSEEGG